MAKGDLLLAKGMQFWGTHGAFPEENVYGAKFVIDVEVSYDMAKVGESDDLKDGFSYVDVYQASKRVTEKEQWKLLQKLATRIAQEIQVSAESKGFVLDSIKVTVKKPFVAIGGVIDYTGVTIVR